MSAFYKDGTRPSDIIQSNIDCVMLEIDNILEQISGLKDQAMYVPFDHPVNVGITDLKSQLSAYRKEAKDLYVQFLTWEQIEVNGRGLDIEE